MKNIFNKVTKGTVICTRDGGVYEVLQLEVFPGQVHNGEVVLDLKDVNNGRLINRGFNLDGTWFANLGEPHPRDITGVYSSEK